ncbi:MAG TPA: pilus assembly protein TadG-related protein [Gammaproteobacteria bacterium]|nr:pilus assembly protein TadG-related protein [Gammaproteobacteria bacterium]
MNSLRQRGAILPMTAILIVVLLAMVGLALDYGRMAVWKGRLQNAVDGAALAAATELDARSDAIDRAEAAAKNMLKPQGVSLEDEDLDITFYETIGSENDPAGSGKVETTSPADAHYVQVAINEWPVNLIFIPILNLLPGDPVASQEELNVRALAGRHFYMCNYPPMMICNPYEAEGKSLTQAVEDGDLKPGDMLILKYQSGQSSWGPGDFAFLLPSDEDGNFATGAKSLGEYLANPNRQGCTPRTVHTRTGSVQSWPVWGWNTRFDLYKGFSAGDYPPAPDVMEYPSDSGFVTVGGLSDRFGNGDWPAADYWDEYHSYHQALQPKPAGWDSWTRKQVYDWEIGQGYPPCRPEGEDGVAGTADDIDCPVPSPPGSGLPIRVMEGDTYTDPAPTPERPDDVLDGLAVPDHLDFSSDPASVPKRRVLFLAAIDCQAQNIHGSMGAVAETFAKFFVLQRGKQGGGAGDIDFVVEFMGLATEQDQDYHVDVQLYE